MTHYFTSFDVRGSERFIRAATVIVFTPVLLMFAVGCAAEQAPNGGTESNLKQVGLANTPAEKTADETADGGEKHKTARKIIYDARIDLLVDSINATEQAMLGLIDAHEGFLAESDQSSFAQNQRRATWRVRVPVKHFHAFTSAVARLGEVRQNHVGSQDITEEFMDLEARIRNKREEEKRLLKHLADSTGKLEDILAVEKELARVRGEAEQMEGRLRFLTDRSDLSTVTIEATEWKDYNPPVAATFSTQVGRTFFRSVQALLDFGRAIALMLVALAPWAPLIVIGLIIIRWAIRHGQRRTRPVTFTPATRS
jgi:hypothetical protein